MSVWIERQALAIAVGLAACMPARAEPMFAEVSLNGVNTGMVVTFERSGAALSAPWGDLQRLGLELTPPADANDDTSADLDRIAGLRYNVDAARQMVFLDAEPALLPHRTITPGAPPILPPDRAVWGAALDYAAHVQGAAGWLGGQSRVFGPLGVLSSSFVARSSGGGTFRRLETQFVIDDYARARSLTIGDFISDALPGRRAVRAGGLHLSTEQTLRPDIFAAPLLEVSGEAGLPSSVELLVDGVRRYQANVDPGRFTLRTPPIVDSRGDLSLVVTDALGRQTVTTQPFYSSSSLLQPGVNAYSLDLGALREDYAGADDHYGETFVAFTLQRGVSKSLSLEAHGDLTGHGRAGGLGAVVAVGQAALVTAAIDASDGRAGAGARLRLAVRRDAPAYSLWLSYEERFGDFSELGRRETGSIAGRDGQMGASLRSARWGDFSAGYVVRDTGRGRYGLVTAAWSRGFGRSQVFANATLADDRGGGAACRLA